MNGTRHLLALAAVTLLLAGCGGSESVSSTSGAAPDSSPSSASPAPAALPDTAVPYAVTGVVRDAAGKPVRGVHVAMTSLDNPGNAVPELAVFTDDDGRYRWPASVAPGRYELRVAAPSGTATTSVTVTSTGPATADLTVRS